MDGIYIKTAYKRKRDFTHSISIELKKGKALRLYSEFAHARDRLRDGLKYSIRIHYEIELKRVKNLASKHKICAKIKLLVFSYV